MFLILVRHGPTLREDTSPFGRRHNLPLNFENMGYLQNTKEWILNNCEHTQIGLASSPSSRCIQSGNYLFGSRFQPHFIEEFIPYHSGYFEDMSVLEVKEQNPQYYSQSFRAKFEVPQFNEESIFDQIKRIRLGLTKLRNFSSNYPVVILLTHYSVINILANLFTENKDEASYADGSFEVPEGGFMTIQNSEGLISTHVPNYLKM